MSSNSSKSAVPDAIFFELSPNIVLAVRIVNVLTLLMVVITFILCLVRGDTESAYYLLACNTVISAFVGVVVNYWYKAGDLGSEKFWYVLVVAGVLLFQCLTTDIFIFKVSEDKTKVTTITPISFTTRNVSWATIKTTNKTMLGLHEPTTPFSLY